jgi:hypothetical protein
VKDDAAPEAVYLMGLALTLARLCLEAEDLEPARDALQKAADYLDQLAKIGDASGCGSSRIKLEADYLAMRIALVKAPSHLSCCPTPQALFRFHTLFSWCSLTENLVLERKST